MANPMGILSKIGKAAKKAKTPAFGGSYDNAVIRRAKEEFVTTHGMDVGQSLSKDYDFINIDKIKPAEKVNEKHVKELMNALEAEDPFNTKIPPVIIDSEGNVLDGHHRIEAAKRLGIKSVPAIEKFETQSGTKYIDAIEQSKAKGGVVDHALKAWHEKKMAAGGEVRMQEGGDAQIQEQLAAGVPVFMSKGPEGEVARRMIEKQEAERRRKAAEQAARVQGLPLSERLKGMYEAGRTVQSALGQEIAKPFVGLIGGESKIKELEEGMPIPETEAGRYYLEKTGEFLEPLGKAFEASKIPDVPFMPEVGTMYIPGIGRQVSGAAKRAGEKLDQAIPESLKNLPVGMSTESVGPKGEKLSINELIRRLEAGEEMTPAERQKAEYSKAQKEKYAQANIAKAQKEPAPKEEEVRVPATEQGFFSSVEKAAANLKREEGSGDAFLSDIMKFNPSKGELEATGIVDFLKGKENLTKQDIVDYINNNQIQIEEVVRGTLLSKEDRQRFNDLNRKISQGYGHFLSPEEEEWFEATRAKLGQFKEPRFEDERLILPGGTNYKELLLKFPAGVGSNKFSEVINNYAKEFNIDPKIARMELRSHVSNPSETPIPQKYENQLRELGISNQYKSSHWPDDPNTFAHVRMQDMDIGGKKTLMIEEIQSDWHQQGRTKGYRTNDADRAEKDFKSYSAELASKYDLNPEQNLSMYATIKRMLPEEVEKYESLQSAWVNSKDSVPDAPFKKDWYQLAIKRIMKYAADNDYDQVALVGPNEQIRRGSLDTYVDGLTFEKNEDGTIKLDAEKNGSVVFNQTVKPEDLELHVGKDVAKRIMESKEADGTLTGDDLKVGGEGMRQYYDRNYPKYLEKQYNKYGINLRKKEITTRGFGPDDIEVEGTGEVDRYGRETMGYTVRDPESGDVVGYGSSMEEALNEANRGVQKTDIWVMDLPAKMKSDVKIGQSYKKGGLVVDESLKNWHMKKGGSVKKQEVAAHKRPVLGVVSSGRSSSAAPAIKVPKPEIKMAEGGSVDQYAAQQAQQSQRQSDIQAYKQGKIGADELVKHFPGMTAAMVEAQLEPEQKMA